MNEDTINKLKSFINRDEPYSINRNINEFMDIVYQNELYEYTDQIYDENTMLGMLKDELDKGNWINVRNMIIDVKDIYEDYFYRDGYGNFSNITNEDINFIVDGILNDYNRCKLEDYDL